MTAYSYDDVDRAERDREMRAIQYDYTCCKERRLILVSRYAGVDDLPKDVSKEIRELEETLEELVAEAAAFGVDLY